MEYVVWAGSLSYYLEMLDKLQKQIYRTVGDSFAVSLEPFPNHWIVATFSLFYSYDFG